MAQRQRKPPSESILAVLEQKTLNAPQDADAWLRWGWALYGAGDAAQAADKAHRAAEIDSADPEPCYLEGMALKAAGNGAAAVKAFRSAAERAAHSTEGGRASMLRRLAIGQANWLEKGTWDLEPETWVRT